MDDLTHVKQVITALFSDLSAETDETRASIKGFFFSAFHQPLVNMGPAFDAFMGSIGNHETNASVLYDRWLNIQMQVYTDLGPQRQRLINDFLNAFDKILVETPGGQTASKHASHGKFSYTCFLMIRTYGDMMVLQVVPEEPAKGGQK